MSSRKQLRLAAQRHHFCFGAILERGLNRDSAACNAPYYFLGTLDDERMRRHRYAVSR
jgi:hypothetical protein